MTTTAPDALAFLASICEEPDADLPRLAYADWLDDNEIGPALAELIRVQVRISAGHRVANISDLDRQEELLKTNADRWRKGPVCERCGGNGRSHDGSDFRDCRDCDGTGDAGGLMRQLTYSGSNFTELVELVRVTYHRGMKRVACRGDDVWTQVLAVGCPTCNTTAGKAHKPFCSAARKMKWLPTDWAKAVCAHHPDVVEFRVTDFLPDATAVEDDNRLTWAVWKDGYGLPGSRLPAPLFDMLIERHSTFMVPRDRVTCDTFDSAEEAQVAVARTVAQWVRRMS